MQFGQACVLLSWAHLITLSIILHIFVDGIGDMSMLIYLLHCVLLHFIMLAKTTLVFCVILASQTDYFCYL